MAITFKNLQYSVWKGRMAEMKDTADGTIPANRLAEVDASGNLVVGTIASHAIMGVNLSDTSKASGQTIDLGIGFQEVITASPVLMGKPIKCADNGRVTQLVDSHTVGTVIKTCAVGAAFTNQPANDGIEILSSSAADTTQTVTIIGTTQGGVVVVAETKTLTGTDAVSTTKTDWGYILAVKLSASCAGTVTVREASANQTVVAITTGNLSAGVETVAAAAQGAFNVIPTIIADGASTKLVGYKYKSNAAADAYEAKALNGATAVTMVNAALTISEVYTGDVEGTVIAAVRVGAEEDELHCIGKAYETATAAGDRIWALLTP